MLSIRSTAPATVSRTLATALLLAGILLVNSGCRLCCDPETEAFPAYGGAWERTSRTSGRVGSTFDPGGARIGSFTPRDSANKVDLLELEQQRDESGEESDSDEPPAPEPTEANPEDTEAERERKFQERLKQFEERQLEDIDVIPGATLPPDVF